DCSPTNNSACTSAPPGCAALNCFHGKPLRTKWFKSSRGWQLMEYKPLRFCLVTTFYPPYHFGGDGVFVYRLAEALAERGHAVDVIHPVDASRVQHPAEPEVAFSHHPNVTIHALRSKRPKLSTLASHQLGSPATYSRQLRTLLNRGSYDVIHY